MRAKLKLVCGIGTNDADYEVRKKEITIKDGRISSVVRNCPYYMCWLNLLKRCFSETAKKKRPNYKDIILHPEWLIFSNFKNWMEQQDWEGKQLDKDILIFGNKLYSPDTCAFVNLSTNVFVIDRKNDRGDFPLGVHLCSRAHKFVSQCSNPITKKREFLGYFYDAQEAHEAWRKRKHELAQLVAETESDPRVVEALKKRYSAEEWYVNKGELNVTKH